LVVEDGRWLDKRMSALRVQSQDIMAAARAQGIGKQEEVRHAIVERNGSVTVFKTEDPKEPSHDN
jgi:uncharacterized membrane protein YcaP (DUF421 family)